MTVAPTPSPLRVCVVLDRMDRGGAERLLLDVGRHLDPAHARFRFVCLGDEGDLGPEVRAAGIGIDVLGHTGRFDRRTVAQLVRLLRTDRTDVVLIPQHARAALTAGRIAARLAGVPHAVAAFGTDLVPGARVLPRHAVETLFLSQGLVVQTPSQARYLREREGVGRLPWRRTREVVIPSGVPIGPLPGPADRTAAKRGLGIPADAVVVGVVARLAAGQGHADLLAAASRLPRSVWLVVVGGGPLAADLRIRVDRLGIADRTIFTGPLADPTAVLPAFDVAAQTSITEAVPLAVLGAMAAGLPVVVTDCGALRELVADEHEGFLVPVADVDALTRALEELVWQPDLRREMGDRARARALRDFRIEHTAAAYERFFASLTIPRTAVPVDA